MAAGDRRRAADGQQLERVEAGDLAVRAEPDAVDDDARRSFGHDVEPAGAEGQPAALRGFGARPAVLDIETADDLGADAACEERTFVEQDAIILFEPRVRSEEHTSEIQSLM